MSYADGLLSTGERITHRNKQHPFIFIWGARYTILAIIIAILLLWLRSGLGSDGASGTLVERARLGHRDPVLRRHRGRHLDGPALHQPGVRADQPTGHPGRGRAQPQLDGQLAREDQRRRPDPVGLRADVRLRRPDRPDRVRERHRQDADAPQPDRVQEGDARREARVRGRHGTRRLGARAADPRRRRAGRPGAPGAPAASPRGRAARRCADRQRRRRRCAQPPPPRRRPRPGSTRTRSPGRWRAWPTCAIAARSRPRSTRPRRRTCSSRL